MYHDTAADTHQHADRITRLARKPRGPWKAPSPSPSPSPSPTSDLEPPHSPGDEPAPPQEEGNSDEENIHLYGFSTDEDSSDDESDGGEGADFDAASLPTVARDDATVKRKLEKAKRKPASETGVVYLGRIPHGFYEDQMRAYFSQFGEISRLRLSRNKRTGKSKHYGFIEFLSGAVAQIVAETMDNYLLMGHILTCKAIPKDRVHPELWVGANRKWRVVPTYRLAQAQHNKPRTEIQQRAAEKRLLSRQAARKRKLAEAGIVYNFEKVAYVSPATPRTRSTCRRRSSTQKKPKSTS
ncbi:hypothetical protein F5148DRAFT_983295 [Russula earlei]|uniref:Uncharacterized protein n=1 Tax=Russula earlei TaxID=71964 RepID=A0ACC0U492_9AGAM|nr:hypothetical protein F5148DRAFT_983295 [Russula earlei]